jgi:hypothetical protein
VRRVAATLLLDRVVAGSPIWLQLLGIARLFPAS